MDVLIMLETDRRKGARESRTFSERFCSLTMESSTSTTRFLLVIYYLAHAAAFYFNGRGCPYAACKFIDAALPWHAWALLFLVQGLLELWRVFDGKHRPAVAWMVHGPGVVLLGGFAAANVYARWPYWVLSVPNVVLALAGIWVCARIAINPGRGFYGD